MKSAVELHDKGYYSSVIHCAYYSCLQYFKHVLFCRLDFTEEKLEQDRKDFNERARRSDPSKQKGLHPFLISKVRHELKQVKECKIQEYMEAHDLLNALKLARTQADYLVDDISDKKSEKAISDSQKIIDILKEKFNKQ